MDCALTRSFSLKNKVIIVTGGATGLGREYSLALAAAGARLVVTDLQREAVDDLVSTIHGYNAEAVGVAGDISEPSTAEQLIDVAKSGYGHLDGLINNAGLLSALALKNWSEITGDEWDRCMAVNLKGAFFCAKAAASEMRETGGSIVNISSGRFFDGGTLRLHYTASKAGIVGLTRGLARELGQFNIRVNCIAPGIVVSDTLKKRSMKTSFANMLMVDA